jgi:hypothetical protein
LHSDEHPEAAYAMTNRAILDEAQALARSVAAESLD